ncbi:MAG: hypothetical protein V4572_05605 [Bacteroidota bacterium]
MELEKLNTTEINFLKEYLKSSKKKAITTFAKSLIFIFPIITIIMFVPMEYLKWLGIFQKGRKTLLRNELKANMFSHFSISENIIFFLIPVCISFLFIYYFFYTQIKNPIKKDLIEKEKEILKITVLRISKMTERMKLDLPKNTYADYYLWLEMNEFKLREHYFEKALEPNLMDAKFIVFERAKNSKIEIKKHIIT